MSTLAIEIPQDILDQAHSRELTARDLLESGLVGLWADRQDIGDGLEFARQLRQRAEHRWETADAAR